MPRNQYIIKLNFNQDIPYFVNAKENEWEETYNPKVATVFSSQKKAKQWISDYSTFEDYAEVVHRQQAIDQYEEWADMGMVRRTFEYPDKTYNRPYNPDADTPATVLDWWINHHGKEVQYKHYGTWPKMYSLYNCISEVCHYDDCTFTFSMKVSKSTKFAEFKKEFDLIKNLVTHCDDEGRKVLDVFDHYLSEHGNTVFFAYDEEADYYAISNRWGEEQPGSLEDVFNYWQTHRWYD